MTDIQGIPVNFRERMVGDATVNDSGDIVIKVKNPNLLEEMIQCFKLGLIKEIDLDFAYIPVVQNVIRGVLNRGADT